MTSNQDLQEKSLLLDPVERLLIRGAIDLAIFNYLGAMNFDQAERLHQVRNKLGLLDGHAPIPWGLGNSKQAPLEAVPDKPIKCSNLKCGNPGLPNHICPYKQDIDGDSETLCNCCEACQEDCAAEI